MRSGTILDFLRLLSDNEALQADLVELASRHGFAFTSDVLDDAALETVAGGTSEETMKASLGRESSYTDFLAYMDDLSERIAAHPAGTTKG